MQSNFSFGQGKILFDSDWKFKIEDQTTNEYEQFINGSRSNSFSKAGLTQGITGVDYSDSTWRSVNLPHDWAIEMGFVNDINLSFNGYRSVGWGYPKNSTGWYRKKFTISEEDKGKRLFIRFDGVYRDSKVWLNGFYLGNNVGGYMEFMFDITDMVNYGGQNVLVVKVNASQYEGWWYEGAGIYRHVWLIKKGQTYIPEHGTYVNPEIVDHSAWINIQTSFINKGLAQNNCQLSLSIIDRNGKVVQTQKEPLKLDANEEKTITSKLKVNNPDLWSVESPNLYKLVTEITRQGIILDHTETDFGIRSLVFDAQKGFFLNGKPVKIKGVCVHQDHSGVGIALPDRLQYYRIEKLKEMGCNAYRTSHNPPTPELLDACDKLGILVMDETRLLTSSGEYLKQFEQFILRDRNHPSVFIWSIGNEEQCIQNKESGKRIAQTFKEIQHRLDPSRQCTYGGNNGNHFEGVNEVVDVRGVNYFKISDVDKYHQDHPNQPIFGSEEASTLTTRGQYFVDKYQGYMSDCDKKENTPYKWCANAEEWWKFYNSREWLSGAFVWTGFDYRGETGPHNWPTVNSHFGVMDICGFPKNNYYYYKSWWTNEDVLHICTHWNWPGRTGDTINVWCQTNCDSVELSLNGRSLGTKVVKKDSHVEWNVVYEPGALVASGYRQGRHIVEKVETTDQAAQIRITPDRKEIAADGQDVSVMNVSVVDAKGREVPDADNFIVFKITGNGKIIGIGNGDPSSHEEDKILTGDYYRRLFNGKCQLIVQSTQIPGEIQVVATSEKLKSETCLIESK